MSTPARLRYIMSEWAAGNGAAHYRRAEQALEMAAEYDLGFQAEQWYLSVAKVHALLALAAATALREGDGS